MGEVPNRALLKATEVCEIVKVQPYVLRSWEAEFPDLGVVRGKSLNRMYRQGDVERVLRLKQLLFDEGLTLAGARRRLAEEAEDAAEDADEIEAGPAESSTLAGAGRALPFGDGIGEETKARLAAVKRGLEELLELLGGPRETKGSGGRPQEQAISAGSGKRSGRASA